MMTPNEVNDDFSDFTEASYVTLIRQTKLNYKFVGFPDVPWAERCVFWRHDIDFSPNRALRLAEIESDLNVIATYFVHIQSSFYNIFEPTQTEKLKRIIALGHRIGLHFDAAYHSIDNEKNLEETVREEADMLTRYFDCPIDAFSFHNPSPQHLLWRRDQYAEIVNCYSKTFVTDVGYCSDSNGYWRYRRLLDVVTEARERHLQVLTHPGHWQAEAMPPRARIFRCVRGRASSTMHQYDTTLSSHGRANVSGLPIELQALLNTSYEKFDFIDFLWNSNRIHGLLCELILELENLLKVENNPNFHFTTCRTDIQTARDLLSIPQYGYEANETVLRAQCRKLANQILNVAKTD